MEIKKRKNNNIFIIIGILLIISGLCFISYDCLKNINQDIVEEKAVNDFYINQDNVIIEEDRQEPNIQEEVKKDNKINYIAMIKIPKINLERGLVDRNSYLNNVKYNVQILDNSSMPDEINGNVILAAHSGNGRNAYFKDLDKLSINDEIIIDYNSKTYKYKVINIYDIDKTGKANIIRNKNASTLTLVTCRHNTNKQIIIIAELMNL